MNAFEPLIPLQTSSVNLDGMCEIHHYSIMANESFVHGTERRPICWNLLLDKNTIWYNSHAVIREVISPITSLHEGLVKLLYTADLLLSGLKHINIFTIFNYVGIVCSQQTKKLYANTYIIQMTYFLESVYTRKCPQFGSFSCQSSHLNTKISRNI